MSQTKKIVGKKILYMGSDSDYIEKLEVFYKEKLMSPDSSIITREEHEVDDFFNYILEEMPHLIILDFSNAEAVLPENNTKLFEQVHFLKRNSFFKGIAFIALFSSREQIRNYLGLISYGVNYFFVKGTENIFSLLDSCYIGFEQNVPVPPFAKARDLNLPFVSKSLGVLGFIGKESLVIESDIDFDIDSDQMIDLSIADGNFPKKLTVAAEREFTDFYFFNGHEFDIPFCGAWDEPSEDNIEEDTYQTWLDFNQDNFECKKGRLIFFIREKEALESVFQLSKKYTSFDLQVNPEVQNVLVNSRPSIIFIQLDIGEEGDESIYGPFISLVNHIKAMPSYEPLIVLFSSPSSKEALEKAYMYNKLVVSSLPYSEKIVFSMLNKLEEKFSEREDIIRRLPMLNPMSLVQIGIEIKITSLTERQITFYATAGIPMYSLMTMSVPLPMLITIVPQVDFLPSKDGQEHYLGIINGISTEDRQKLRRFINFLIHKKPKQFAWVDPKDEEKENLEENGEDNSSKEEKEEEISLDRAMELALERDLKGDSLQKKQRGRRYEGKSKL